MTDIKLPTHKNFVNIQGNRYGRWTVVAYAGNIIKNHIWLCKCDCGNEKIIRAGDLKNGKNKSCGCFRKEFHTTHGMKKSSEYRSWLSIKMRCLNTKSTGYHLYGGRGITICDRWLNSFENFLEDMGLKPTPKHSIDRIDVNGNYEKSNCRWVTAKEQSNNKRNTIYVNINNKLIPLAIACIDNRIKYETAKSRLMSGYDIFGQRFAIF